MRGILPHIFVSRKNLFFLCLSVASVVFFLPTFASAQALEELPYNQTYFLGQQYASNNASNTPTWDTSTYTVDAFTTTYIFDLDNTSASSTYSYFLYHSIGYNDNAGNAPGIVTDGATQSAIIKSQLIEYVNVIDDLWLAVATSSSIFDDSEYVNFVPFDNATFNRHYQWIGFVQSGTLFNLSSYESSSEAGAYNFMSQLIGVVEFSSTTLDSTLNYGFNSTYQTRFTDLDITGTSTVEIDVEYYLHADELNPTISERNPTLVNYEYSLRPSGDFSISGDTITPTAGTSTSAMQLSSLADGTYDLLVRFSNIGASLGLSPRPFPDAYVYTSFTISGGVLTATGTNEFYDKTVPQEPDQYRDCSLTQLQNCLINAGIFLFTPSTESVQNFVDLKDSISTKFPFDYVAGFKDVFANFYTTATTQSLEITVEFSTFGDITLLSADLLNSVPFASTLRTIMGYLLWLMFGLQVYRRVLLIFNSQQEKTV